MLLFFFVSLHLLAALRGIYAFVVYINYCTVYLLLSSAVVETLLSLMSTVLSGLLSSLHLLWYQEYPVAYLYDPILLL